MTQAEPNSSAANPGAAEPLAGTQPSQRRLELRAMLLLVLMALLVVGAALYLMWARGAFEATQPLYLSTDDSDGVMVGMDMTFSGFPIGRVRSIELARGGNVRIQVDVPLKDAHWLRQSSVFTLEKGVVGGSRLRAFSGVPDDDPLPPGAERLVLRGDMTAELPGMVSDARDVLQNVNALTGSDSELLAALRDLRRFAARLDGAQGGVMGALTGNPADAQRVSELLQRANRLVGSLDAAVAKADRQMLGPQGLVGDAQTTVRQLDTLLQDLRRSVVQVDGVLKDVQAVAGNARVASEDLGDLRADVEASLRKVDALVTELNRKWPFAPRQQEVTLP